MNSKKRLIIVSLLFSALLLGVLVRNKSDAYFDTKVVKEKIDLGEETIEIKKTVEDFIQNNFSYLYSSSDYSLIDSDSKVFLRYLELRNSYRETTLAESGETKDKYSEIKNKYRYKDIDFIEDNFVKISADVNIEFRYEQDKELSSLELPYEVYLIKKDGAWRIWSAKCEDSVSNPFDDCEKIDIISMSGVPNSLKKNNIETAQKIEVFGENDKILSINRMYNEEMKLFFDGSKDNIDLKKIDNDVKEIELKKKTGDEIVAYSSNGYINRGEMYRYMMKYANSYNREYISFSGDGGDCANFGSQILYAGGATKGGGAVMDGKWRGWDTKNGPHKGGYGHAWIAARYLRGYIIRNNEMRGPQGHVIKYGSSLKTGDFCFLDTHRNGGISHTTIVSTPGPNFKICAHSENRRDVPINTVHPSGKNGNYRSYVTLTALY